MKGGIEVSLVLLFGTTFFAVAIGLTGVLLQLNQAKVYAERIVDVIEHYDGHTSDAQAQIDLLQGCKTCQYSINHQLGKYDVKVTFDINVIGIDFSAIGQVAATSKIIN